MLYVVFIFCLLVGILPVLFFDVVHYTFKNKVGNVLNNTQNLNSSIDRFGFNAAFISRKLFSLLCAYECAYKVKIVFDSACKIRGRAQ